MDGEQSISWMDWAPGDDRNETSKKYSPSLSSPHLGVYKKVVDICGFPINTSEDMIKVAMEKKFGPVDKVQIYLNVFENLEHAFVTFSQDQSAKDAVNVFKNISAITLPDICSKWKIVLTVVAFENLSEEAKKRYGSDDNRKDGVEDGQASQSQSPSSPHVQSESEPRSLSPPTEPLWKRNLESIGRNPSISARASVKLLQAEVKSLRDILASSKAALKAAQDSTIRHMEIAEGAKLKREALLEECEIEKRACLAEQKAATEAHEVCARQKTKVEKLREEVRCARKRKMELEERIKERDKREKRDEATKRSAVDSLFLEYSRKKKLQTKMEEVKNVLEGMAGMGNGVKLLMDLDGMVMTAIEEEQLIASKRVAA